MLDISFGESSHKIQIPDGVEKALHDQVIDDTGPGTVLLDFETLLEFVGEEGLPTTSKCVFLPQGKLDQLNAVMSHPVAHRLKRPQQRSFPHLQGLYLLLRASEMELGAGTPPNGRLMLDAETVEAWRRLNATERYFTLMESWLIHGSPEVLGERECWSNRCLQALIHLSQTLSHRRSTGNQRHYAVLNGTVEAMTAALMELFGWVRLVYGKPAEGEGVKIEAIERLPLGDAMINALFAISLTDRWPTNYSDGDAETGVFLPLFQPYFPEYQRKLIQKEAPFRDGTYTWRVSLSKAWRQIVAPADMMLDDLAMMILDAFDFEADHLYCFELRQANGRTLRIACPYEQDASVFTDEISLGDLSIAEGGTMTMLFDYGDAWRFTIKLEKVAPPDENLEAPRITAEGGTPPVQYESYEDEYEDDE